MRTIVVSPYNVLNFTEGGGHFWVYMQYVQGLRQLGCEVYWLEQFVSGGEAEDQAKLAPFLERMNAFGLNGQLLLYPTSDPKVSSGLPRSYVGRSRAEAEAIIDRADLLLNFHYAIAPELLARFRRTALVDIDPGLLQFWISRKQLAVPNHHLFFTTGETVGTPAACFPDCGLNWLRIRPPVSLECWPWTFDPHAQAFTTVSNWNGGDWIVDGPEVYENSKRVTFLEMSELPNLTPQPLELALFLRTEKDAEERRLMESKGWRIRHSREVANTPEKYQGYIQQSRGEFSCAKRSCMKFQNAWISDRTLCYLASGKPVVVQNTGPSALLPNGEGMFRFSAAKEAARALEVINSDYEKHSRAARQIVETYFDAKHVVKDMLSQALS